MTNVPKKAWGNIIFMPMNHILCQKSTFLKGRAFSNGEFLNVRNFWKNTEFCVKTRVFKSTHFFKRGIFKNTEFFEKHGSLC